jgi:hypothetical protein
MNTRFRETATAAAASAATLARHAGAGPAGHPRDVCMDEGHRMEMEQMAGGEHWSDGRFFRERVS